LFQRVLTKIKIAVTGCHILRLKCTKIDFFWGSAPDPAGGAYSAPPDPLPGFERSYTSKRGEGKGEEWRKEPYTSKEGNGRKGKEGNGLTSKGGKGREREERGKGLAPQKKNFRRRHAATDDITKL